MRTWRLLTHLVPFAVGATIVQIGPITDLFNNSDLVCLAAVVSGVPVSPTLLDAGGKLMPVDYTVNLQLNSCYKRVAPSGGAATLSFRSFDPMQGAPLSIAPNVLFFLKKDAPGAYVLADPAGAMTFWAIPARKPDSAGPQSLMQSARFEPGSDQAVLRLVQRTPGGLDNSWC